MEGRTGANSTDTPSVIGYIPVTRWHWRKYNWQGREALSVYSWRGDLGKDGEGKETVSPDCLAVAHLPAPYHFGGLRCLAVPRFGILHGRYGSLPSLTSAFTWTRTFEWILRGLWDVHRCFTSSLQDQWWLSCACALHFLALPMFHSDVTIIINHKFLVLISFHSHSASRSAWKPKELVDLCWRASARSLWISHGGRRARGGNRERWERGKGS